MYPADPENFHPRGWLGLYLSAVSLSHWVSLSSWDATDLCVGRPLLRARMVNLKALITRVTANGKSLQEGVAVPNERQLDVMWYLLPRCRGDKLQEHGKELATDQAD